MFPPHVTVTQRVMDLHSRDRYIAGGTSKYVYVVNPYDPLELYVADHTFTDTFSAHISIPPATELMMYGLHIEVDSPYVYMIEGLTSTVLRGSLSDLQLTPCIENPHISSSQAIPVSATSLVMRTYDRKLHQNILTKLTTDTSGRRYAPDILKKQVDGVFCTDGMLHYNANPPYVAYVYFYRNQFVVTDTSLNLLYSGNTIDTNSTAKIKPVEISSTGTTSMAAPPVYVNKTSCVSGNWLFVNSALKADNEARKQFSGQSVIDVYSAANGHYQFSFYLPDVEGHKVSSFRVFGNTLVALQSHYLIAYQLKFPDKFFRDRGLQSPAFPSLPVAGKAHSSAVPF